MALDDHIWAEIFIQLQNSIRYFGSPCIWHTARGVKSKRITVYENDAAKKYYFFLETEYSFVYERPINIYTVIRHEDRSIFELHDMRRQRVFL